jgi:hypothetical protein
VEKRCHLLPQQEHVSGVLIEIIRANGTSRSNCSYFRVLNIFGTLCIVESKQEKTENEILWTYKEDDVVTRNIMEKQSLIETLTYAFVDALVVVKIPRFTISFSFLLNSFYAALN